MMLPLSYIIMAKLDSETGVPDLAFSRFYNCRQEANWEKKGLLRITVTRENVSKPEMVSIPIPVDTIGGIAVFTGMNRFDKLLEA